MIAADGCIVAAMRMLLIIAVLTGGLACEKTIKEVKAPAADVAQLAD